MPNYTIEILARSMIVHEKILKKSRLNFQGDGVNVYVKGRIGKRRDTLNYQAFAIFKSCNVALIRIRDVGTRK